MSSITALILGLIQGITEFLPISSSGHLVLAEEILDYSAPGLLLETVVHVATTLAVIIFFRRRFAEIIRRLPEDPATRRFSSISKRFRVPSWSIDNIKLSPA